MANIVTLSDGSTWEIPNSGQYNEKDMIKLIEATVKKGEPLTTAEINNALGWPSHVGVHFADYKKLIDSNSSNFGYSSNVFKTDSSEVDQEKLKKEKEFRSYSESMLKNDYESMVEAAYEDRLNLMTDPTGANAQRFRDTMYGAIANEQAVAEQSLGQAELDAYRMLGRQQLELENTIAEQRKKALVSGTTSAQLAAGQLQNMFAAQSGAAQVAQSLANQRTQMNQAFAEKRTGVETSLYDYINQQQTIAATAGAQNLAALSSYASYANKNYNDMMSLYNAKNSMPNTEFEKLVEIIQGSN